MLMHNNQYKLNIFQVQKVPGTRSHHCFIPLKNGTLKISRIAGEQTSTNVLIHVNEHFPVIQDLQPGNYIAAVSWEMLWKYSRTVQMYALVLCNQTVHQNHFHGQKGKMNTWCLQIIIYLLWLMDSLLQLDVNINWLTPQQSRSLTRLNNSLKCTTSSNQSRCIWYVSQQIYLVYIMLTYVETFYLHRVQIAFFLKDYLYSVCMSKIFKINIFDKFIFHRRNYGSNMSLVAE